MVEKDQIDGYKSFNDVWTNNPEFKFLRRGSSVVNLFPKEECRGTSSVYSRQWYVYCFLEWVNYHIFRIKKSVSSSRVLTLEATDFESSELERSSSWKIPKELIWNPLYSIGPWKDPDTKENIVFVGFWSQPIPVIKFRIFLLALRIKSTLS